METNVNDVCERESTANSHECPTSMTTSPPVPPLEAPSYQPQIYRTSSLPGGMNERGVNEMLHISSPVQLRLVKKEGTTPKKLCCSD